MKLGRIYLYDIGGDDISRMLTSPLYSTRCVVFWILCFVTQMHFLVVEINFKHRPERMDLYSTVLTKSKLVQQRLWLTH
jgi:hypothetical protein